MKKITFLLSFLLLLTSCYRYIPVNRDTDTLETGKRYLITRAGKTKGVLFSYSSDSLLYYYPNREAERLGQRNFIEIHKIDQIRLKEYSGTKTTAFVTVLGLVVLGYAALIGLLSDAVPKVP